LLLTFTVFAYAGGFAAALVNEFQVLTNQQKTPSKNE
jgi:hypothetical protein